MMKTRKLTEEQIYTAWGLYLEGKSLRDLKSIFGVSVNQIQSRFIHYFGKDYAKMTNKRTIYRCVKADYLKNKTIKLSNKQRQEIEAWLENLTVEQKTDSKRYLSEKDIYNLTAREVCWGVDLRWMAETFDWGGDND